MTQGMIRRKRQKPLSPPPNLLDLGTWGRFYTWPAPQNFKMPRLVGSGAEKRLKRVCLHCGGHFKTNREEQRFCKDGCRTYNNRLKRDGIIRWMTANDIPYDAATDVMYVKGLAVLSRQMEALGLFWNGMEWEKKA